MSRLVDGARVVGANGAPRLSMLSRGMAASTTCPGSRDAAAAARPLLPLRPDLSAIGWAPPPLLADLDVPPLSAAPSCACQPSRAACAAPRPLTQTFDAGAKQCARR
jgi:hypothetical protein